MKDTNRLAKSNKTFLLKTLAFLINSIGCLLAHEYNINFNIDSRGRIVRTVVWEVIPDVGGIENWDTFSNDIEAWANSTNGQLRDAAEDPTASHINADYLITDYSVNYTGQWIAEVTFNAVRKETEALMISGVDEQIEDNGEKTYSATFKIHADNIDGWLPQQNDVIAWAGAACMCLSINKKEVEVLKKKLSKN